MIYNLVITSRDVQSRGFFSSGYRPHLISPKYIVNTPLGSRGTRAGSPPAGCAFGLCAARPASPSASMVPLTRYNGKLASGAASAPVSSLRSRIKTLPLLPRPRRALSEI